MDGMKTENFSIEPLADADRSWVSQLMHDHWGGEQVISRGKMHTPAKLPGFVGWVDGERVGLLTYHIEGENCEVVSLDSLRGGLGIGTKLIESAKNVAVQHGCQRLWLITTNDNVDALRFYQKRGFVLVAVHRNALDVSRKLKPSIPETGAYGIPIRDEIELEITIGD